MINVSARGGSRIGKVVVGGDKHKAPNGGGSGERGVPSGKVGGSLIY